MELLKVYIIIIAFVFIKNIVEENENFYKMDIGENYGIIKYSQLEGWKLEKADNLSVTDYVAKGRFINRRDKDGVNELAISTNSIYSDELQAEAAGRLEAYFTVDDIYNFYRNVISGDGKLDENLKEFFIRHEEWIIKMHKQNPEDNNIYGAYLMYLQLKGVSEQYNELVTEDKKIEPIEFNNMNAIGDMPDLKKKFMNIDFSKMTGEELEIYTLLNTHCSGLYKMKEDLSDVLFAQSMWGGYHFALTIMKEYNFNYNHHSIKAKNIMISSYPSCLTSPEDFYITSQKLVVSETTNCNYNESSFKLIVPESLLTLERGMICNRIATGSREWVKCFEKYNSGSYNNMYMVLDMKKLDISKNITNDEILMIVEQMPQFTITNDVSDTLNYGYWPSYNIPYNMEIRKLALLYEELAKHPELESNIDYDKCARCNIFRRDQSKINDVEDMKKLFIYNNFTNDPFTLGDPSKSIACRADIRKKNPVCHGATTAKAGSLRDIMQNKKVIIHVYQGPIHSKEVGTFDWTAQSPCSSRKHYGIVDKPEYNWTNVENLFDFNFDL